MLETIPLLSTGLDTTCNSSTDTKAMAYAQIKSDIDLMQKWILKLKYRHNSLSHIARLPPEILGNIFTSLMYMHDGDHSCKTPWIKVSFVCSYWRRTALNCPELWSVVKPGNGEEYLSTMNPRTGEFPLSVSHWGHHLESDSVDHIIQQMHRIRRLDLANHHCRHFECIAHKVVPRLTGLGPVLESFHLKSCSRITYVEYLPDDVFSGTTSQIREIHLVGWMLPSQSMPFGSLKALTLMNLTSGDAPRFHQLLDVLHNVPNVVRLVLKRAFRHGAHEPREVVHLPFLQFLDIEGLFPAVHTLYSHIHYPITANVRLAPMRSRDNDRSSSEETANLHALTESASSRVVIRSAHIKVGRNHFDMSFSRDGSMATEETSTMFDLPYKYVPLPLVRSLFEGLQLAQLQYLSVERLELTGDVWHSVFGRLPFLTTIAVRRGHWDLVWMLGDNLLRDGTIVQEGSGDLSFRPLHTLVLQQCDLYPAMVQSIMTCVRIRASRGTKLHRLRIIDSQWLGITAAKALEWLQPYVEQIELDGAVSNTGCSLVI
ncbi:hypothetical protein DXG01_005852 [Tephrocybe rancida]|nr:hypothetical protein DXG01_005852 [Tephrocybe rancida]